MKKKELMTLTPAKLTAYMRKMAKKEISDDWVLHSTAGKRYYYKLCLRAKVEKGYLIVSVYHAEYVRAGARHPSYVVYFDKKADDFITFETDSGKWRESMLYHLDGILYLYNPETYISRKDEKIISGYLGTENGTYKDLRDYQEGIRERQLIARHKKKTDVWDEVMKQVPGLPKDWERWVLRNAVTEHYIFYKYKRGGATEGYCTHCGKTVVIKNPKYNQPGVCKRCGQKIIFKSVDKAPSFLTGEETAYLIQRCGSGIILRRFNVRMALHKGDFQNPEVYCFETKRFLYDAGFHEEPYYYGNFKNRGDRWKDVCRFAAAYRDVISRSFPDLVEEARGIAEGSCLSVEDIMVINCRYEMSKVPQIPECSDTYISESRISENSCSVISSSSPFVNLSTTSGTISRIFVIVS